MKLLTCLVAFVALAVGSLHAQTVPTISSLTNSQRKTQGESLSLSVSVNGTAPFAYQWNKGGAAIAGATASTYTIDSLAVADAGTYTVTVTNAAGSVTSGQILIDVTAATPPSFNYQPDNLTCVVGDTMNFYASVSGSSPMTFVWKKGTDTIATTTSYSYSKPNVQTDDAGSYTVTVSNVGGTAVSQVFTVTVNPLSPPRFTSGPYDATIDIGGYLSLYAYVDRDTGVTYQWYKDSVGIEGATSSGYWRSPTSAADAGSYTVKATNNAGTTTSRAAVVTVRAAVAPTSVSISSGPVTVTAGETLSLYGSANGTAPLTFQWKKDGVNIAGATSSSYYKSGVTADDAGTYALVVSNSQGSATSTGTVVSVSSAQAPIITQHPISTTIYPGDNIWLSVSASGTGSLGYQWRKDGADIPNATSSSFWQSGLTAADAGAYTVVVTSATGSVTSRPATVTVLAAVAPVITSQPKSQSLKPGQSLSLRVSATGSPSPTYQWKKDGVAINGATSDGFYIDRLASSDSGSYSVTVTNSAGTVDSSTATVNVASLAPPVILTQPASASLLAGDTFYGLSVGLTTDTATTSTIAWYRDGTLVPNQTSNTYYLYGAQPALAGTYKAVVTNAAGSTTSDEAVITVDLSSARPVIIYVSGGAAVDGGSSASLNVSLAPGVTATQIAWKKDGIVVPNATNIALNLSNFVPSYAGTYTAEVTTSAGTFTSRPIRLTLRDAGLAPRIVSQPYSLTLTAGSYSGFEVTVEGETPVTYQWRKDGVDIPGATNRNYPISSATAAHAGNYSVVVTNRNGSATSVVASLVVKTATSAPILRTQPASQTVVSGGGSFSFAVSLLNETRTETYQWYKDGLAITGATGASYYVSGITQAAAGRYTVKVTNSAGSTTSDEALVTVTSRATGPTFTTQPSDQTGNAGGSVTFTAAATGGTVTYQWRKNGTAISGATNATLTLTNLQSSDAGNYTVLATNADGTTTSSIAVLTVNASTPPQFTQHPASANALFGGTVTFTAAASGAPVPTYQWKHNDVAIAGATAASLTLSNLQAQDAGTYTVVATNAAGSAASNGATLALFTELPTPPAFTMQPQSVSRPVGSSARFTFAATGTTPLSVQWFKNGTAIAGATSAELLLSNIKRSDVGDYTVVLSNPYGTATSATATLSLGASAINHVYQGTLSTGESWALVVCQDQTAQFLGYVTATRQAIIARSLIIAPDGTFAFGGTAQAMQAMSIGDGPGRRSTAVSADRLFSGRISGRISGDAVSGDVTGVGTLSGAEKRGSLPNTGWYDAVPLAAGVGELHAVAMPDGNLLLVDVDGASVRGAVGTVTASGSFNVTSTQFTYTGSLNTTRAALAGTWAPTGGSTVGFGVPPANGDGAERLVNVSTRALAGTDSDTLIIGFVITGAPSKDVMVRAIGPTLESMQVTGYLTDPRLKLFQRSALLRENDNWGSGNDVALVTSTAARVGAYPLPAGSTDAVMLTSLSSGVYTAHVNSHDGRTGVALMEVYDADSTTGGSRIVNLSARSRVGHGDDILIVGFVITGSAAKQVLIRGLGPRLVSQSVTGALENPRLRLFQRSTALAENDDWSSSADRAQITAAAATVGATALDDGSRDAAMLAYLAPGVYTAQVSGVNDTTGVALVEVYDVP